MTAGVMRGRRSGAALAPALAALTLLGAGALVLLQQGSLMVHQCVTAGSLGRFGVSLALLRDDVACPSGSYGIGDGQRVIGVAVAIALPVLIAHLVGAGLGVGLASRLHRLVRAAVGVVLGLRPRPTEPARLPVLRPTAVDVPVVTPRARAVPGGPWWRGPPEVGIA
jgi:hypothetical protein